MRQKKQPPEKVMAAAAVLARKLPLQPVISLDCSVCRLLVRFGCVILLLWLCGRILRLLA